MGDAIAYSVSPARRIWAPPVVLILSLALTVAMTLYVTHSARNKDHQRLENEVQATSEAISIRISTCMTLLHGTAAYLTTGPSDNTRFTTYVAHLSLGKNYPGMQGIGYSVRIPPEMRDVVVSRIRKDYSPDFRIWPDYPRDEYHSIVWLAPPDRRNQAAMGYDMFTEPVRRQAMETARDTGAPAVTSKVTLIQEIDDHKQAGFLIYVPVYLGWDVPATIELRRKQLLGFVYGPFRVDDLLSGVFSGRPPPHVAFQIYDGVIDSSHLIHRSADFPTTAAARRPEMEIIRDLDLGGRTWKLRCLPNASFEQMSSESLGLWTGLTGLAVSVALFTISWMQARARQTAERIAAELQRARSALADYQEHLEGLVKARTAELEQSHEQLRRSERLASLGTLATGIAHEINNPANAILLSAEYALSLGSEEEPLSPELAESLQGIVTQSKRCGNIVRNVLRFARNETGHRTLQDLNAVVQHACEVARAYVREGSVVIKLELGLKLPPVSMNPEQIEQVLINLIQNASDAGNGTITVEIETKSSDDGLLLRLADDGPGIAAEHLQHIFDPFFSTRREKGGTGLGLSMAHGIITDHAGRIEAKNREPRGAEFIIWLPLS